MKFKWFAVLVVLAACKPAPETKTKDEVVPAAKLWPWTAKFVVAPFKNPDILNYGEVLELLPSDIVDRHIARVDEDWVYDFDLLSGGPATAIKKGAANPGSPRFIVSNGSLTALRGDGKITVVDASHKEVAEFDALPVRWARGASEQAAMAWDNDALWVLSGDAVLHWEAGKVATLFEHDQIIRRLSLLSGSLAFEHEGGWTVVWPKGAREVTGPGEFTFVGMNPAQTEIWRKSNTGVSVATVNNTNELVFQAVEGLQDADSIFIRDDKMMAQWWPAEALWLSDYAKAAWIKDGTPGEQFAWGAAWPQTVQVQEAVTGLGSTPSAVWSHDDSTKISLNSAASSALFFDGTTIVRHVGNLVQRLGTEQPSKVFDLRVIRQIMCSGETCLVLGREGGLDRVDLKNRTRETILFIHTGETLSPLLAFPENATVLCEPRCVTKTGEFVSGLIELDVQSGVIKPQVEPTVLGKGVLAQRVFDHPSGVKVSISEMERAAHKLGRPPRFFQIDLGGIKDGNLAPAEWIVANKNHAYFTTAKTLESRGDTPFSVDVMDARNLVSVEKDGGTQLMHLQGRGPNTKLFVRDGQSGEVISEQPAPNISAFSMVGARIFYALEDGRLVLADL